MKSQPYLMIIIVAVVVGAVAFFGGLKYQESKDSLAGISPQDLPQKLQSLGFSGGGTGGGVFRTVGGGTGGTFRRGGGLTAGRIISKDSQSITIKMNDGSTKIIYLSSSTAVTATTAATTDDLKVGTEVTATGTPNSDGSIAAQTVQIRPTTTTQ
ncbi:hypothetical protein KGQ71_02735 [Patescibacteria group bacterium]|nr:hypothetical protein [Patescibacteria group bacterium]